MPEAFDSRRVIEHCAKESCSGLFPLKAVIRREWSDLMLMELRADEVHLSPKAFAALKRAHA